MEGKDSSSQDSTKDGQQRDKPYNRRLRKSGSRPDSRRLPNPMMGHIVSNRTPIHEAAIHGSLLALKTLLRQGWPVNVITADHVSPLHEACLRGHSSCAHLLLKHGALVNAVTIEWHTPLFNACISGNQDCVNLLLKSGASLCPSSDRASPLHEAAKRGHMECVESLAIYGGDLDHHIRHLGTPLYLACENQQIGCVRKLLESGASVNHGRGRDSPLHAVARTSCGLLARLLINFGADTQAKNAEGKRPFDLVPPDSPLFELFLHVEGPPTLMQLCRLRIRKYFGIQLNRKISGLLLPQEVKEFLLHI